MSPRATEKVYFLSSSSAWRAIFGSGPQVVRASRMLARSVLLVVFIFSLPVPRISMRIRSRIIMRRRLRIVKRFPLDFSRGYGHIAANAREESERGSSRQNGRLKRGKE